MREDIKKRIDLIKNGEVPLGYIKTKVGIISEEWERVYLKDIFKRCEKRNNINSDNILTISAQEGLISQEDFFDKEIASANRSDYYLLERGDFVYNKSYSNGYPFGAIKRLDLYDQGIVSPLYMCFKPRNEINTDFYVHYFESGMVNSEIKAFAQEGARNHGLMNISIADFFNMSMYIPNEKERKEIGSILNTYSKKTELISKLIREKKNVKQWLLSTLLMRSNVSANIVKLEKISEKINEKNKDRKYSQVLSNSAKNGVILQEEQFKKDIANNDNIDGYYVIHPNDFVYNPRISVSAPCGPININSTGITGVMSPLYTVFKIIDRKINLNYLNYYFQSTLWHKHMKSIANYGARFDRMSISQHDFFSMPIILPSISEQKEIVRIMQLCEQEILSLSKKMNLIKEEKKAMMQLLLTGIIRVNEI